MPGCEQAGISAVKPRQCGPFPLQARPAYYAARGPTLAARASPANPRPMDDVLGGLLSRCAHAAVTGGLGTGGLAGPVAKREEGMVECPRLHGNSSELPFGTRLEGWKGNVHFSWVPVLSNCSEPPRKLVVIETNRRILPNSGCQTEIPNYFEAGKLKWKSRPRTFRCVCVYLRGLP